MRPVALLTIDEVDCGEATDKAITRVVAHIEKPFLAKESELRAAHGNDEAAFQESLVTWRMSRPTRLEG